VKKWIVTILYHAKKTTLTVVKDAPKQTAT